ncbi:YitT family protein [Halocella sp. SP3-1]|uniref:YitT family protein n=1 Tax=Halocella sp. SP3-1 TaxID=2382161 RepID=UPI000F751851|nr:YitT family protein [Halocella sp. SP3-1]AZO94087.1 YitT family protein [Halocella sp. SP3-1]
MKKKKRIKRLLFDIFGITVGSALAALSLVIFLIPNRIAAGGISGLATIIYYLTEFPVGILTLVLNIPLFIAVIKVLGLSFGIRTIYGMITFAVFIDLFQPVVPVLTHDLLLATIYGGIVGGLGLGIVFNSRGTTGGTDMAAKLINHYTGLSVGESIFLADGIVVLLAGIFFNAEVALYAAIAIFIHSKVIDLVQEGLRFSKAVFIISTNPEAIKDEVMSELDRGVTILNGYGGYTGDEKDVLFCIISRTEVAKLKRVVSRIDRKAFVIITNVHEVLGEGFKEIS